VNSSPPSSKKRSSRSQFNLNTLGTLTGSGDKTPLILPSSMASKLTRRLGSCKLSSPTMTTTTPTSRQKHPSPDPLTRKLESDWRLWLPVLFPSMFRAGFGQHHGDLWDWVWRLRLGQTFDPFVGIWARGGGKSSSAETANIAMGARRVRRYALYVSETQDQADKHVMSVGGLLEGSGMEQHYPLMASRDVNKYGSSRGWRRNRLTTAAGFTIDAVGLDVATRGIKIEDRRPDAITLDDIDGRHDTEAATLKKIETLTESVLPAGSPDVAVLAMQNLIIPDGIFSRLADGRADFLATRTVSGPFPAVRDLRYALQGGRALVTGGEALWVGQSLAVVQHQIDTWGLSAFLRESQQEVAADPEGALWRREWIAAHRVAPDQETLPDMVRLVVGVDPSGSKRGDEVGIVVAGVDARGHGYVLADLSLHASPDDWARVAVTAWDQYRADSIVAEANFGGEMVESLIRGHARQQGLRPPVRLVHASRGKAVRAEPIAALYQAGQVHHVGILPGLEDELCRWQPSDPYSPGRLDACLVAGTLVETNMGPIPIERVHSGHLVLTRKGYRSVLAAGMTNADASVLTVTLSNGHTLTGTANHPVWVQGRGYTSLSALVWDDILETWTERRSSLTASRLCATLTRPAPTIGTITRTARAAQRVLALSTKRYGKRTMGLSLKAATFTTRTATALITTPPILSVSTLQSTHAVGGKTGRPNHGSASNAARGTARGLIKKLAFFVHGCVSAVGTICIGPTMRIVPASCAGQHSTSRSLRPSRRALADAPGPSGVVGLNQSEAKNERASSAARLSWCNGPNHKAHAPVRVVTSCAAGTAPVYNLEVEDMHEYYANGVLVHNCVWALSVLMLKQGVVEVEDDLYDEMVDDRGL